MMRQGANVPFEAAENFALQVDLPADEVPPEVPEPALGINFARDGMQVICHLGAEVHA